MRKISKESEETDLFVDPRELTKEEHSKISEYIKLDKQKRKSLNHKLTPREAIKK